MSGGRAEPTVVLDTNLIISSQMAPDGNPARIIEAWRHQAFTPVTSPALLAELADVLARPRLEQYYQVDQTMRLRLVADFSLSISARMPLPDLPLHCRDQKDDIVLACALGVAAGYIVSGDQDLLALDGDPRLGDLRIVSPEAFLAILGH